MFANLLRKVITLTRSDGLTTARRGERVWHITPAGEELFGPDGPDVDLWIATGLAVLVKINPARTVYRIDLPGGTVFVKHCKITGVRSWAREVIRLPKARLEFENSQALRDRHIPAVEPLAWGHLNSSRPGESYLITRGQTAAVPFVYFLERVLPTLPAHEYRAVCRQIAIELGRFLARLHDAGVTHPDPHPGNFLFELPSCRIPRFSLIDLHAIQIGKPLGWSSSRDNLVLFNRWFQLRCNRVDRARFWHAYRYARKRLPLADGKTMSAGARELERETEASNLRFWSAREHRCLVRSRHFQKVRLANVRGWAVRDISGAYLHNLLANPDAPFQNERSNEPVCLRNDFQHSQSTPRVLKDSPTSTVVEMTMPGPDGPIPVVLKRVNLRSSITPIKNLLRQSQVMRSWINGHALRDRRLATPRPLAAFHRYRCGMPAEGYLLTEKVPGGVAIDVAIAQSRQSEKGDGTEANAQGSSNTSRDALNSMSRSLARLLRAMHDRDVSHRDLKAANILLANGEQPMLIDLVGVRTQVRLTDTQRAKELARLNASFLNSPHVNRADRLRFLLSYLSAGKRPRVDWKIWWDLVWRATEAKAAKNRRQKRMLG